MVTRPVIGGTLLIGAGIGALFLLGNLSTQSEETEQTTGGSGGGFSLTESAPIFGNPSGDTLLSFPDFDLASAFPAIQDAMSSGDLTNNESEFLKKAVLTNRLLASQASGADGVEYISYGNGIGEVFRDRSTGGLIGGTDLARRQSITAEEARFQLDIDRFSALSGVEVTKKERDLRMSLDRSTDRETRIRRNVADRGYTTQSDALASFEAQNQSKALQSQLSALNQSQTKKEATVNFTPAPNASFEPLFTPAQ